MPVARLLAASAVLLLAGLLPVGCRQRAPGTGGSGEGTRPARVGQIAREADLASVTLAPAAAQRLGLQVSPLRKGARHRTRTVGGEVVVPPGRTLMVTAPVAGTVRPVPGTTWPVPGAQVTLGQTLLRLVPLAPVDRDLRAQARRQLQVARARQQVGDQRLERARQLVGSGATSQRGLEDAQVEQAVARAETEAARARLGLLRGGALDSDVAMPIRAPQPGLLRQVLAGPGQSVAAGASLFELAQLEVLWIRVPLYVGDLALVDDQARARVRGLGAPATAADPVARAVAAPPSADPLAATADLFFELEPGGRSYRPGERLAVTIAERTLADALVVPLASIVYDIQGGTWVYVASGAGAAAGGRRFERRRVELQYVEGEEAVLSRGPAPGTPVVSVGANELFALEFGHAK